MSDDEDWWKIQVVTFWVLLQVLNFDGLRANKGTFFPLWGLTLDGENQSHYAIIGMKNT